jgi:hypothetical protein
VPLSNPEPYKVDGYDELLEAVKLGGRRQTKARDFVPKMYQALVTIGGLAPQDAADRIYRDLLGIWQKQTIRRLLPLRTKELVAKDMLVAGRAESLSASESAPATPGVIILPKDIAIDSREEVVLTGLKQEISQLKKTVSELEGTKRSLLKKTLRLERELKRQKGKNDEKKSGSKGQKETTMLLLPHLFMKTFTLMRSSTAPLVLTIAEGHVTSVDEEL